MKTTWSLTYGLLNWYSVTWHVKGVAKTLNTNLEEGVENSPKELKRERMPMGRQYLSQKMPKMLFGYVCWIMFVECKCHILQKLSSTSIMGFSKIKTIISLSREREREIREGGKRTYEERRRRRRRIGKRIATMGMNSLLLLLLSPSTTLHFFQST